MYFNIPLPTVALALLLIQPGLVHAQIELVHTPAKLPTPRYSAQAVYDGQDSIYFTGGWAFAEFFKYSLSTGDVTVIGSTGGPINGGMVWVGNGQIYYFGGALGFAGAGRADISRIQISTDADGEKIDVTQVAQFPAPLTFPAAVWDEGNAVYILGGINNQSDDLDTIFRYELGGNTVTDVGRLDRPRWTLQGVWDGQVGAAYVLGVQTRKIIKYEPGSGDVTTLGTDLPDSLLNGCPVVARQRTGDTEIFLMGFFRDIPTGEEADDVSGIVWFSPKARTMVPVEVSGWPQSFDGMGCVYVEKLNRIYLIGGSYNETGEYEWTDRISYIDLGGFVDPPTVSTTPVPTTTSGSPIQRFYAVNMAFFAISALMCAFNVNLYI